MISHEGASHLYGALQTHQQRTYLYIECILIIYHLETLKEFVVLYHDSTVSFYSLYS